MTTLTLATSGADSTAVETLERRHAELLGSLTVAVDALRRTTEAGDPDGWTAARDRVVARVRAELRPHLGAEESVLYPSGRGLAESRLLVAALLGDHRLLGELGDRLASATDAVRATSTAEALLTLLVSHVAGVDELLLPSLASSPSVALAELVDRLPVPASADGGSHDGAGHACGCGMDAATAPGAAADAAPEAATHLAADEVELDARVIPHAVRHATVFGALDAVVPGGALILLAPHDPLPLLKQIEQRTPGTFGVEYLLRGPDTWRLRLRRTTA